LKIFTISKDKHLAFSLSPSLLRPLAKLAETKIFARVNVKKIKAKKYIRLLNRLRCSGNDFLPKFVNNGESRRFFGRC
jgi:hypothetical protein